MCVCVLCVCVCLCARAYVCLCVVRSWISRQVSTIQWWTLILESWRQRRSSLDGGEGGREKEERK